MRPLLTRGASSPKLTKRAAGIEAVILHLSPGITCPWATRGCLAACLNTAGRGAMEMVQNARKRRTDLFFDDRIRFMSQLKRELTNLEKRAARKGWAPVARLNGTSDIPWERMLLGGRTLFEMFPKVTFYDYTKSEARAIRASISPDWPSNYTLTLSRTEEWGWGQVDAITRRGINVAVVFEGKELPSTHEGVTVIDGRRDDWRFKDPTGVVVGLSALGRAKRDESGFVVKLG
jgi:hypothetical protein